jgi:acyl carrier protein
MSAGLATLQEIFRIVFDLRPDVDPATLRRGDPPWDSLAHVSLVAAIESEFRIQVDPGESDAISSFDAAAALLGRAVEVDS